MFELFGHTGIWIPYIGKFSRLKILLFCDWLTTSLYGNSAKLKVEHPRKFIREQFQSEGSLKILYLEISQYTELKWTNIQ